MNPGQTTAIDTFQVPFAKQIELIEVEEVGGVKMLKIRIREGARFTLVDLDPVSAKRWGEAMVAWADSHFGDESPRDNGQDDGQ